MIPTAPKSVKLNGLILLHAVIWVFCVNLPKTVALGANYIKLKLDRHVCDKNE